MANLAFVSGSKNAPKRSRWASPEIHGIPTDSLLRARFIRSKRRALKLSQEDCAEHAEKMSPTLYRTIENGGGTLTNDIARRIAKALKL